MFKNQAAFPLHFGVFALYVLQFEQNFLNLLASDLVILLKNYLNSAVNLITSTYCLP